MAQASKSSSRRSRSSSSKRPSGSSKRASAGKRAASGSSGRQKTGVAAAASKAKAPLMAAGVAIAGTAGGLMVKNRAGRSKNPMHRLRGVSLPRPNGKLDIGAVKATAERVTSLGQQAADIAAAIEKTQKKNN